jgi:hypothetical protein
MYTELQINSTERDRDRESTMMQLSHCVVCILNSSCNKNRVEATEFPKQRKTWKIKHMIIIPLITGTEDLYDYHRSLKTVDR